MRLRGQAPRWCWLTVAGAFAVLALVGSLVPHDYLIWRRDAVWQCWRLWTAGFAHLGAKHLALNVAAVLLLGALGILTGLPRRAAAAWVLAVPLTHAGLWAGAEPAWYAGLSGVAHAGAALAALFLIAQKPFARRSLGLVIAAALLAKIWNEAPWEAAVRASAEWYFPVVVSAHAWGVVAGFATGLMAMAVCRVRRAPCSKAQR